MAIALGTVWEVRATGSQVNGGGFYNRNPGTSVDYSQQDTAELTLTDLATDAAGTGLSSATGGFTAEMVGNIIQISGGTLTAGWYEITAYTDTNNVTIDRSAGASQTGGTGNVGGAFLWNGALAAEFLTASGSGNTVWVKAGTHSLSEVVTQPTSLVTGTTSKSKIIGYNTTRGDTPTGDDRPLIQLSTYAITTGAYSIIQNIRMTGIGASLCILGNGAIAVNCYGYNSAAGSNYNCFYANNISTRCIACEAICTNGYAFRASTVGNGLSCIMCYAHDSVTGIYPGRPCEIVVGCVVDTCTTGLSVGNDISVINNTVYNCTTGISLTVQDRCGIMLNNIIDACTTSFSSSSANYSRLTFNDFNCVNGTTDYTNFTAGENDIDADPLLNDPASGDFTLASGSPCFDAAMKLGPMTGL